MPTIFKAGRRTSDATSVLVDDGLLLLLYVEHVPNLWDVFRGDAKADDDGKDKGGG